LLLCGALGFVVAPGCSTRDVYLVAAFSASPRDASVTPLAEAGPVVPPPRDAATIGFDAASDDGGRSRCETTRTHEQPQPLGIYMMVDQSTAMLAKWGSVASGLQSFLNKSNALGKVSAGIQYYALSPTSLGLQAYSTVVCQSDQYVIPDVPLATLPGNQLALVASITNHGPSALSQLLIAFSFGVAFASESPADGALKGAIQGARAWAAANAGEQARASVLLVTPGLPAANPQALCHPTLQATVAVAAEGVSGSPSVSTYVLALDGPSPDLDAIAAAGGTRASYPVTGGSDVLAALESIRVVALPCDVAVDPTQLLGAKLNVEIDAPFAPRLHLGRVRSASACDPSLSAGQWYADSAASSGKLRLCPRTCESARALPGATLDVVLGCPTIVLK
jgi:hypothetical protein